MADNLYAIIGIGETGVVLEFTLKHTDPDTELLVPLDLTGWNIAMIVEKGSTVLIDEEPCDVDPDQVTNKGKASCTINATVDEIPGLRSGKCKLRFKGFDPNGRIKYFPKKRSVQWGTLEFVD